MPKKVQSSSEQVEKVEVKEVKETKHSKKASKVVEPEPEVVEPVVEKKETKKKEVKEVHETKEVKGKKETAKKADTKKSTKKTATKQKGGDDEPKRTRYFKCIYRTVDGEVTTAGRYCGKKPKQAASKALTGILKATGEESATEDKPVFFLIAECTRNSRKKKYSYSGFRKELDEPVEVAIKKNDGKNSTITYRKTNVVKKVDKDECQDLFNHNLPEEDEVEEAVVEKKGGAKKTATKKGKNVAKKNTKAKVAKKNVKKASGKAKKSA